MKTRLSVLVLAAVLCVPAVAAEEQTWVGTISDSDCGAKHKPAAEHEAAMSDADCTQACVKAGAKYVLVSDGKVLEISNQDFVDLPQHAGQSVKLTGELSEGSIQVTKIETNKKS